MRIVVAPDKFKGCLPARDVAAAIARGIAAVDLAIAVEQIPMADGGEGTVDALVAATSGRLVTRSVNGPLPDMRVDATFGILGDGETAVIEMAAASGLALLRPEQHNPEHTTTYGTGELIMAAYAEGATRIILGIGGSATIDGGVGCAQACGVEFDVGGQTIAPGTRPFAGGDLRSAVRPRGRNALAITVACDVTNPLTGANGAARIFGPQKGAIPAQVEWFDARLAALARSSDAEHIAITPGAGAAGGLGFGLVAYLGATLRPGFDIVAEAVGLPGRIAGADLVITGEGQLDASSLGGKTAIGVARLCRPAGVPCVALVGAVGEGAERAAGEGLSAHFGICDRPMTLDQAIREAPALLERAAANLLRVWRHGR